MSVAQVKEPKKPNKAILIGCGIVAAIFLIIVIIVALATCSGGDSNKPASPKYSGPAVEYKISGTAKYVDVTLANASGGTEQYGNVYVPRTYSYNDFPNYYLYISAQNQGEFGSVTVSIYVNGNLYKTSTSSGSYVIASASGSKSRAE
jgi:hypothetical protein